MNGDRSLVGKVALVTGASRGIGRACAESLARAGARVAMVARSVDQVEEVARAIRATGAAARGFRADVTVEADLFAAVKDAETEFGPIEILVNNAGLGPPVGPVALADPDEWWRTVEVNLRGPMLCMRAVLPRMLARGRGRIINVSSGAGSIGIPYLSAYVVSKTALTRLTEVVAAEVMEAGIAVFAIEPGTVRTAMAEQILGTEEGKRWMPWFHSIFDEGRDVTAVQAADLIVGLASGVADSLSGRFLSRRDDLSMLIREADEIVRNELYKLRINTLD